MRKLLFSSLLLATSVFGAEGTLLQGTLLDAGCSAIGTANVPDIPRGTASPTATGAGKAGAYTSMGTSGSGSQAGMSGTNAGTATVRKTERAATATGAGTSGAYTATGIAGSAEPVSTQAGNKYAGCQVAPATETYAVQTGDAVILLDEASNRLIRRKLKNRSQSVILQGKLSGDRFTATSVKGRR